MRYLCKTPALPAILVLCWLGCSSLAVAAEPGVHDQAGIFNKESIDKANAMLKDIQEKTKKTVVIETYKGVPVDKRESLRAAGDDPAKRSKFYLDWVQRRGQAMNLHGTFILVCVETEQDVAPAKPHNRVEIWSDPDTLKTLPKADHDALVKDLGLGIRDKKPNEGLIQAVTLAQKTMEQHFAQSRPLANVVEQRFKQAQDFGAKQVNNVKEGKMDTVTIILWIIGGLVVFWIIIGLVRALTRPRYMPGGYPGQQQQMGQPMGGGPPPGYGQPYGAPMGYGGYPQRSGSGFFGNMMAGMFGAAAGNYIYDQWFRGGHSPSSGGSEAGAAGGLFGGSASGDTPQTGYATGQDFDQPDAGSAPAGGDYDQDVAQQSDFGSGGGDFGGGGGDVGGGGGDFGGGGGDFGGGGGDVGGGGGGDF